MILDARQPNVSIIAEMEFELTFEREVQCVKFQTEPAGRAPTTARGNDPTRSVIEAGRSRIDAQVSARLDKRAGESRIQSVATQPEGDGRQTLGARRHAADEPADFAVGRRAFQEWVQAEALAG